MKKEQDVVSGELKNGAPSNEIMDLIHKYITRRDFLVGTAYAGLGVTAFSIMGCGSGGGASSSGPRQIYVANSKGMVVADSTLCVGCRRCEVACVAFNFDHVVQPSISRVKVNRNINFGVVGTQLGGFQRGLGDYGNFRTIQDTCRQCPHPVPCQLACPHGAIEVIEPVNARVVNLDKCAGCGICTQACPWAMSSLTGPANAATTKATKCTLCGGNPECVQACPVGALKYLPWADRTKDVPPRQVVPSSIQLAADVKDSCTKCH